MAKPTPILCLNLGSQTIRLAEFQLDPNGRLTLCNYRLRESLIDPANDRLDQTELQLKCRQVNYAVAAQSVFTRFVKLPAIEKEKIDRIIAFEAQQNVPFPIEEVVWDYQLVGGGGEEQVQVVLVAIKADLLARWLYHPNEQRLCCVRTAY